MQPRKIIGTNLSTNYFNPAKRIRPVNTFGAVTMKPKNPKNFKRSLYKRRKNKMQYLKDKLMKQNTGV